MKLLKLLCKNTVNYLSSGHFLATEPWTHMRRISDSFEIIIGVKGTLYIQQEEEKYQVNPGDILLLLPGRIHEGYKQVLGHKDLSFYWLHFKCDNDYEIVDEEEELSKISVENNKLYYKNIENYLFIPTFYSFKNISRINVLFKQLLDISHSNYYTKRISDHMLTTLLFEISEETVDIITSHKVMDESINMPRVLEWIKINSNKSLSLQDVADEFKFNKKYFAKLFKLKVGVTVNEYITSIKLDKSKELLIQTDLNIKELAFLIGFQDEKYFMKVFKNHEQLTPTEFRNAYYRTFMNNN